MVFFRLLGPNFQQKRNSPQKLHEYCLKRNHFKMTCHRTNHQFSGDMFVFTRDNLSISPYLRDHPPAPSRPPSDHHLTTGVDTDLGHGNATVCDPSMSSTIHSRNASKASIRAYENHWFPSRRSH